MDFFQTKLGKTFIIYFIVFFITSLFCGLGYGESFVYAITAVIFIIPITLVFGAILSSLNIKKFIDLSFEEAINIIFILEWIYVGMLASSQAERHNKNYTPQPPTANNYVSYTPNYTPNINTINQQSIPSIPEPNTPSNNSNTQIINGLVYNLVAISPIESVYLTIPTVDSFGYKVNALDLNYRATDINNLPIVDANDRIISVLRSDQNTTLAITPTNCSVFNKRINNLSSLSPKIYVDGELIDIFNQKSGIAIANYICNYKQEN